MRDASLCARRRRVNVTGRVGWCILRGVCCVAFAIFPLERPRQAASERCHTFPPFGLRRAKPGIHGHCGRRDPLIHFVRSAVIGNAASSPVIH